jgi:hypothetical protein
MFGGCLIFWLGAIKRISRFICTSAASENNLRSEHTMVKVLISTQQGNSNVAPLGEASQIPLDRMILRRLANRQLVLSGLPLVGHQYPQTPFRMLIHGGDPLLRQTEPGGPNQIKGSGRYMGFSTGDGVRRGTGASGNQHYVYDSSVYTKYKRLFAKQKNYNDPSFGGDNSNGSYVAAMAVVH